MCCSQTFTIRSSDLLPLAKCHDWYSNYKNKTALIAEKVWKLVLHVHAAGLGVGLSIWTLKEVIVLGLTTPPMIWALLAWYIGYTFYLTHQSIKYYHEIKQLLN
jgi:hypothetical protein